MAMLFLKESGVTLTQKKTRMKKKKKTRMKIYEINLSKNKKIKK
jgi:hypothetical protein